MSTGDPGACSSAGAWLGGLSRQLDRSEQHAHSAGTVDEAWTGRAAREAGRRHTALLTAATSTRDLVAELGTVLQDHATDLTAATADVRRIRERAAEAGLTVHDDRVQAPWGISGVADATDTADRDERVARLQRDLDLGLTQLARRRDRLTQALQRLTTALAEVGTTLRS